MKNKFVVASFFLLVLSFLGWIVYKSFFIADEISSGFDGERAFSLVEKQLSFGPRIPGTMGHDLILEWLEESLREYGWDTEIQNGELMQQPISNLISKKGIGTPWIIIGAHYDTRIHADRDPDLEKRTSPVPGANDGASGVAVLLELARVIPNDIDGEIWLVFFDAEDNGDIPGWDWILGSRVFVNKLDGNPDAVIIVDMIGDADQNIYIERKSDFELSKQIWGHAAALGYVDHFIPIPRHTILDDHIPFLQANIPAVDIIDFDYPYWHTVDDTLDKISAESLQVVGDTLLAWLAWYVENGSP